MTREGFFGITSDNNKKRITKNKVLIILLMYAVILVSVLLEYEWWVRYDWLFKAVSGVYIIYILSIENSTTGYTIIRDNLQRLNDKADYNESPYFTNNIRYYFAPIKNGDYLVLSNEKYLKFTYQSVFYGKDIDMNYVYRMKIQLLDYDKIIYETKGEYYDKSTILIDMYERIKKDGLDIVAIYNKFGDLKWIKKAQIKKKYKIARYKLKIYQYIYIVIKIIILFLPVLFMYTDRKA